MKSPKLNNQTNETAIDTQIKNALAADGPVLAAIRAAFPETLAVYAFGSRINANANANADSDLDLSVLVAGYADPLRLWELSGELADIVGCPVDLLDMRAASTVMQYQILQTGRRLWGSELEVGLFEVYVLSEKTELDTARAGLLADIQTRGSVYGR
ncbi:MAG: nucleotidyltransferase domain-containing protein [Methylococcales bacterium]|nr:nucleotidyltransferase domain-containing protein [Methylococcaceae bacterium]